MQELPISNLERWRKSGHAEQWVRERAAKWDHQDWLRLLGDLQSSPYWPMEPDDIGLVLEHFKQEFGRPAAPEAPQAALPTMHDLEPALNPANRGLSKSKAASLLALCIAALVCVVKYAKRNRRKRN